MRNVAANTGQFMSVPVVRIYTVEDYFEGLRPAMPVLARNAGWFTKSQETCPDAAGNAERNLGTGPSASNPSTAGTGAGEQRNRARRRSTGKASAGSGGSGAKRGTRRGENWCGHRKPSGRRGRSRTGGDGSRLGLPGVTRPAGQWRSRRSGGCQGYRGLRRPRRALWLGCGMPSPRQTTGRWLGKGRPKHGDNSRCQSQGWEVLVPGGCALAIV